MKPLAIPILALALSACATHTPALAAERALDAGSLAWDQHVDAVIEDCREQDLPTKDERAACVGDVARLDEDVVAPAVTAGVLALRAYWLGVAVGEDRGELARHLADFAAAVAGLPAEFFGGLRGVR